MDGVAMSHMYLNNPPRSQILQRTNGFAVRALGVLLTAFVLQSFGMGILGSRHLQAQQPPPDTVLATTLFETQLESPHPGPVEISVATIALAPGQASLSLTGNVSLLILVESGSVVLSIDRAIEGLVPVDESDEGTGSDVQYRLRAGQRVTITEFGKIQFQNEGDESTALLLVTLAPEGGQPFAQLLEGE